MIKKCISVATCVSMLFTAGVSGLSAKGESVTSVEPVQEVVADVVTEGIPETTVLEQELVEATALQQGGSPYAESTLESLIEFCEKTLREQEEKGNIASQDGTGTAGQLSYEKAENFRTLIKEAKECTDVLKMPNLTTLLLLKGYELMASGIIDDTVVYETKNKYLDHGSTLRYSEHRAKLEGLVWKAEAKLLVDPALYPESAKDTLRVELDRAKQALEVDDEGKSKFQFPFSKCRMYYADTPDSMLQYVTSYTLPIPWYGVEGYGLEPVLDWYDTEYILYEAAKTVEVKPSIAGYVNGSSVNSWTSGDVVSVGKTPTANIAVLQFDLSGITGALQSAQLKMVASKNDKFSCSVYLEEDDFTNDTPTYAQLTGKNGSYKEPGIGVVSGELLANFKPKGKDVEITISLSDPAISEAAKDGKLTISMQADASNKYADGFYGPTTEQGPVLIVTTKDADANDFRSVAQAKIGYQRDLLQNASTYSGDVKNANVGDFSKKAHDEAIAAMNTADKALAGSDVFEMAVATVDFLNKAHACRMSVALLSDIDVDEEGNPKGNLFFSSKEVEALKSQVKTNSTLKKVYTDYKQSLNTVDLDAYIDYYERYTANDLSLWKENRSFATNPASGGGKYVSGRKINNEAGKALPVNVPSGHTYTGKAYVTLELASEDNDTTGYVDMEGTGCGEVWFDNFSIESAVGKYDISIPNGNFETKAVSDDAPLNWTLTTTGNGEGRWESDPLNVSSGSRSLYFHNPDGNSSVTWTSSVFDMPVDDTSESFNITFSVQQYGVFEVAGVQVKFHFLTETSSGESEVVSAPIYYNAKGKPSVTGVGSHIIVCQRAAIMAMLAENDAEREYYAELSKYSMLMYLDEYSQGVENYHRGKNRPDGFDGNGAVQCGRHGAGIGTAYAIVKNMKDREGNPIFSEEEKEKLTDLVCFFIRNLNDMRDLYEVDYSRTLEGGNWRADMNNGAALLALAFEDTMPYARYHLYSGIRSSEAQLNENVREDGSWPESVRYHNAAITKLLCTGKAMRASVGIDWFTDNNIQLYRTFEYLVQIQTPRYVNGNCGTPWFGDHTLTDGEEMFPLGLYYDEIIDNNPDLGLRMYGTWVNAGNPSADVGSNFNQIHAFFGHSVDVNDYGDYQEAMKSLTSTDYAKYWGVFIMRNNFMEKASESYLATIIQEEETGHANPDQMSFIYYADNIPLVVDPGRSDYWSSPLQKANTSHSLVAYVSKKPENEDGEWKYYGTGTTSTQRGFYSSDSLDMTKGTYENKYGEGEWMRDIAFIKNGFEAVVVYDQITGADQNGTMMNLPLMTKTQDSISQDGNKVTAEMFGGVTLEITYLEGNYENVERVIYPVFEMLPKWPDEKEPKVNHLRIHNDGNDGYLTVLFPKTNKRGSLTTQDLGDGVYKLTHSTGNSVYVVANGSNKVKTVTLPESNVVDLENPEVVYESGTVTVAKNAMKIFTSNVTTTQEEEKSGTGTSTEKPVGTQSVSTSGTASSGVGAMGGGATTGGSTGGTTDVPQAGQDDTDDVLKDSDTAASVSRNLATGQKARVECDVTDDVTVTFQSSNEKVATVSSKGLIKTKKSGTSNISVLVTKKGVTQKVTIRIKVKDKKNVPSGVRNLGEVKTTKAGTPVIVMTKTMKKAGSSTLTLEKKEGVVLSYSTSDKSVVTVNDSGKMKGKGKGTADVIAKVTYNGVVSKYLVEVTVK